jgi:hypothetical protein
VVELLPDGQLGGGERMYRGGWRWPSVCFRSVEGQRENNMRATSITRDDVKELLAPQTPPCLSVYLPTHRRHPEKTQDPVRFKNLLKELEASLLPRYNDTETQALLAPFRALTEDSEFWNHLWEGLAVLGTTGLFRAFRVQQGIAELAVVAESFHVKPLLRVLQASDRFQVLSVSRQEVHLFEGDHNRLDEVELAESFTRTEHQENREGNADESDVADEQFFRAVDQFIHEHHSRPSGLPLVLAALTQHQATFHRVSHNPLLLAAGVETDPGALTTDALLARVWPVVEPEFIARMQKLTERFEEAQAKGMGTDNLVQAAKAAAGARIETLFVEADREMPGRIDQETGGVTVSNAGDARADDLLDDLAEMVLRKGGQVRVLAGAAMPVATGLAATYRY